MTDEQRELLEKARLSLAAARHLLLGGYPDFAASRAYYTMFYVAEALLENEGMAFSSHAAVIAAFGQHFAHPGRVPVELHRFLIEAQDARHDGDYGGPNVVPADKAQMMITRAQAFLEIAARLLGPLPKTEGEGQ